MSGEVQSDLDWLVDRMKEAGVPQPGAEYDVVGMLTDEDDVLTSLRSAWEEAPADFDDIPLATFMGRYRLPPDKVVLLPDGEPLAVAPDGRVVVQGSDEDAVFVVHLLPDATRSVGYWEHSVARSKVVLEPPVTEMLRSAGLGSAQTARLLVAMAFAMASDLGLRLTTINIDHSPGGDEHGSVAVRVTMSRPTV